MSEFDVYNVWCEKASQDADVTAELYYIENKPDEIKERFYKDLEFGTGGLRGIIGAGINRMNIYTVRKATQGLANYIMENFEKPCVAVSYDSRLKSKLFAQTACEVLAGNGIKAYLYDQLMPTPMLSYAVRRLNCKAGIMITASHNPSKYNGYKAYGEDGCQLNLENSKKVTDKIKLVDPFNVNITEFQEGLDEGSIEYIPSQVIQDYYTSVMKQSVHPEVLKNSKLKVVYTPLNGTGNIPVRVVLDWMGVDDIVVVPEQEQPDGLFPTCPYPNPEIREALDLGLKLCEEEHPDLLLATDPDADRVGIAVPDANGEYVLFSGNEVGALLLEYLCRERTALGTMPENPVAVKTIVTTDICKKIAEEYGVELREVLTGFKFIGEQIGLLEADGEEDRYVFGFEESYGYLSGTYVRDKDAVVASMLICEMTAFYKTQGLSLVQARDNLYKKYGVYHHTQESFQFEGISGMMKMSEIMEKLRNKTPKTIGGLKVLAFEDYEAGTSKNTATDKVSPLNLPQSNVLAFRLDKGASVIIRPSGTEPKIKAYYTTIGETKELAVAQQEVIATSFRRAMGVKKA